MTTDQSIWLKLNTNEKGQSFSGLILSSVLPCTPATCPTYTHQITFHALNLCSSKSIHQTFTDTLAPTAPGWHLHNWPAVSSGVSFEDTVKGGVSTCTDSLYSFSMSTWLPVSGVLTIGSLGYGASSGRSQLANHTSSFSAVLQPFRSTQAHTPLLQLTRKVSWWWTVLSHSTGASEGGLLQRM